jgi:hypothetical protein
MAKAFGDSAGGAKKKVLDYMKFEMGPNKMRIVGPIIARYSYWKQLGTNNIPVECLSFDRDQEAFTNVEKDWFKHYFPKNEEGKETRCIWSYVGIVIDGKDGKLKLVGFKKKLFEQIQELAEKEDFGDPTNPESGWWIYFNKKKTGPHAFNVEYTVDQLESMKSKGALTDEEKALVDEMPNIDELVPRPTAEQQKAFIENAWLSKEEENVDEEVADEFEKDIPF